MMESAHLRLECLKLAVVGLEKIGRTDIEPFELAERMFWYCASGTPLPKKEKENPSS